MEVQRNCPIKKTGKCTKLHALIVVRNVKSHSSQTQAGRFTAEIVGRREDRQEEADISQEAPQIKTFDISRLRKYKSSFPIFIYIHLFGFKLHSEGREENIP